MSPGPAKQFDRDAVLERAMQVFWKHGYEGTGMALLLEHMGIGRQSLYDTFGDKRALYLACLDHYFRTRIAPMASGLRGPGSALQNLLKSFRGLETMIFDGPQSGFGCMVGNGMAETADQDPEVAARLRGYLERVEALYRETLERAKEAGELQSPLSPEDLARLMVNTFQGLALLSKIDPDRGRAHGVLRAVGALLSPS